MIEQILEVVNFAVKNVERHIERLDRTRAAETYYHVQNIEITAREIQEALNGMNELVAVGNARIQETIRDERKHMEHFIKSELDGIKQDVQKQMMGGYGLITHQMEHMMMVENYHTSLYRVAIEEIYKRSEHPLHASRGYYADIPKQVYSPYLLLQCSSPWYSIVLWWSLPSDLSSSWQSSPFLLTKIVTMSSAKVILCRQSSLPVVVTSSQRLNFSSS